METAKVSWRELRVFNDENHDCGSLEECLNDPEAHAEIENITLTDEGAIDTWPDIFIAAADEEPDSDTPRVPVDWTGFRAALAEAGKEG